MSKILAVVLAILSVPFLLPFLVQQLAYSQSAVNSIVAWLNSALVGLTLSVGLFNNLAAIFATIVCATLVGLVTFRLTK